MAGNGGPGDGSRDVGELRTRVVSEVISPPQRPRSTRAQARPPAPPSHGVWTYPTGSARPLVALLLHRASSTLLLHPWDVDVVLVEAAKVEVPMCPTGLPLLASECDGGCCCHRVVMLRQPSAILSAISCDSLQNSFSHALSHLRHRSQRWNPHSALAATSQRPSGAQSVAP